MKKFSHKSLKALAFSASALAFVVAGPANAQDAGSDDVAEEDEEQVDVTTEEAPAVQGGITVTGSRIVRDTYSSISPLQVLTTKTEQQAGVFDPTAILQRSEAAAGVQIDATFQGFVLDNGPGSTTLDLRGLGADRTLLLINGRRLAPAGVEGAPTSPSLNLLPSTLIERYDLLLDGASSVYGSDAVAGVGNVILRKDFDGLELTGFGNINPQGGGDDYTVGAAWGFSTDRGFFGIGAEYDYRDSIRLKDRDFFRGCTTALDITQSGDILRTNIADQANALAGSDGLVTTSTSECVQQGFNGRIFIPFTNLGSVYYDETVFGPQAGNSGIPFFSESFFGGAVDFDGDGIRDVDFLNDYNLNGANDDQTFLSQQKRYNILAYGEYTFPGEANITPFFEAMYTRAEVFGENEFFAQIFPYVPDNNAFNPCNTPVTGIDCRADTNFGAVSAFGEISTRPIFAIEGDRNNTDVVQEQYRGVFGVRGDMPFIGSSWSFEASGVYSRAEGTSNVRGIREDKLAFALGIDPTMDFDGDGVFDNNGDGIPDDYNSGLQVGNGLIAQITGQLPAIAPCDASALANPDAALADLTDGCVPVNLFASSVLNSAQGDFETAAERAYVFGDRSFVTVYEQIVLNAFVTGDLFEMPAGPVGVVLGAEWRQDKIDSQANSVASNGLFFGFFADSGASGSKWIREAFAEVDIPLMANQPFVEELTLNVSGRITDEEFYGTNGTFSIKGGWRPVSPLLLKFSYGTSFRAPNLRENFLGSQTGFNTLFDPCAVPDNAVDDDNNYDASLETRDADILRNCFEQGRDPTTAGLSIDPTTGNGLPPTQFSSVEIARGGSLDIDPETSRSITTGFSFDDTIGDGFNIAFGMNYYDIKVKDSIVVPSAQFIVNDCYTREEGQGVSPFCERITISPTTTQLVSDVFAGFLNLDQESVRGMDFNARFSKDVNLGGEVFGLGLNVRANHLIERSSLFINDDGSETFDDDAGEVGLQDWTGRASATIDYKDLTFAWTTRYVGGFDQDPDLIDDFSDVFGYDPDGEFVGASDTCLGGGSRDVNDVPDGIVPGDGVFCRAVGFADEQFLHTASLTYSGSNFEIIVGVSNIFDTAPPQVSPAAAGITDISNTVLGAGYDYNGREFFGSINYRF